MFYIRHTLLTSEVRFNKTEINWSHKINAKYMYVLFKNIHKCLWRDIVCKLFLFLFKGWQMLLKLWKIFPMLQLPLVSITCKINKFYFTACRFNEILPVYRLIIIYHKRNYHLLHFIVNIAVFILQWKRYADLSVTKKLYYSGLPSIPGNLLRLSVTLSWFLHDKHWFN